MQTDQKNVMISDRQKDPNADFRIERQFNKKVYSLVPI